MAETYSKELIAAYTLSSSENILEKLRILERNKSLLTITPDGAKVGLATSLLKIVPEKNVLALEADKSQGLNERLFAAKELELSAEVNGADVRFTADRIDEAILNRQNVLAVPIPKSIFWMQRRESYRVPVFKSMLMNCRVPLPNDEIGEFQVLNISLLGLALLDKSGRLDFWGRIGQVFGNCRLLMDGFENERFALEIRNKLGTSGSQDRPSSTRVGFAFRDVSRIFVKKLQRFIFDLEREKRRRLNE